MSNDPGGHSFVAFDVALQVIESLRPVVPMIRRHNIDIARQIVNAASSVAANLAEGSGREGNDRRRFFRIAAGSAEETRAHLRVAHAWGWIEASAFNRSDALLDRQLALLWRLVH